MAILKFLRDERGATAVEYGLIAALVAVTALVGMTVLGGGLTGMFGRISNKSVNAMSGG